jgi:hypothetical protein
MCVLHASNDLIAYRATTRVIRESPGIISTGPLPSADSASSAESNHAQERREAELRLSRRRERPVNRVWKAA